MSQKRTILIGVAGGSFSGKTSVCERIMKQIAEFNSTPHRRVDMISMSSFYRKLTETEQAIASAGQFNFDHPEAFDFEQLKRTLTDVCSGRTVSLPVYDKVTNRFDPNSRKELALVDVLLVEGILLFYSSEVRELFDVKLFVDCDSDTRLARRVRSDLDQGRELETVLQTYTNFVKPAFEEFCLPTKKYADLILPRGAENSVAVDIMVLHVRDCMQGAQVPRPLSSAGLLVTTTKQKPLHRQFSDGTQMSRPH